MHGFQMNTTIDIRTFTASIYVNLCALATTATHVTDPKQLARIPNTQQNTKESDPKTNSQQNKNIWNGSS